MLALLGNNVPISPEENASEDEDGPLPHQCMSSEAMQKLFEMRLNNQLCDATVRVDEEKTYNIHRAIMCACSSYFR
jgi:kelch-like protein 10